MGEHLPCKQGVKGSNPFISTGRRKLFPKKNLVNCILKRRQTNVKDRISGKASEDAVPGRYQLKMMETAVKAVERNRKQTSEVLHKRES